MKQVTGQSSIQRENHIIWDELIAEEMKLRPQLDYVLEKEVVIQLAKQSVTPVREILNKKPIDYAKNAIDLFNGLTEEELNNANIKVLALQPFPQNFKFQGPTFDLLLLDLAQDFLVSLKLP